MKGKKTNILLILIFVIGLSLLLYPSVSNWWNSFHQTRAITSYNEILSNMDPADYSDMFLAAEDYNTRLYAQRHPLLSYEDVEGYTDALDITDTGLMGYISIPSINVELPIYHGTSEGVLSRAVGHLEGSTLPIGGENTHSVLSAHRGLPSAKLFTDMDRVVEGDIFQISVLDRVMTYQVDRILIVDPDEIEALEIVEGEDYCTLVTCTPYGINTHRLLVRGTRVENPEEQKVIIVTPDAVQIEPLMVAPLLAIPILLVLLIMLLVQPKKKKNKHGGDTFEDK